MFNKSSIFTPAVTPKIIKRFIGLSVILTLLCSIVKSLIFYIGFSSLGFDSNFFWQPATFVFLHSQTGTIHLFSILYLFFSMYGLWIAGSEIVLQKKSYTFLILFFGSGLLCAFASYFAMSYFQNVYVLFGMKYTTFSLLVGWMMLRPSATILFFHSFPVQVSHLVNAVIIIQGLTLLSNGEYLNFLNCMISTLFAYLYAIIAWRAKGPYGKLHVFENRLANFFRRGKGDKLYDFEGS